MMPMHLSFTRWETLLFVMVYGWPVAIGIALLLALVAVLVRRRWMWWVAAGIPAIYLLMALVVGLQLGCRRIQDAELERLRAPLREPRTLDGAVLPVGTIVNWNSTAQRGFSEVTLPGVSSVLGVPLEGTMTYGSVIGGATYDPTEYWDATLAADADVEGWPCAKGRILLTREGEPELCTLGAAQTVQEYVLPERSEVSKTASGTAVTLGRAMPLPALHGMLAKGAVIQLDGRGCLVQAIVDEKAPVQVHGVGLWSDRLRLGYGAGPGCGRLERVRGNLARDFGGPDDLIEGVEVEVNVATGAVQAVLVGEPDQ